MVIARQIVVQSIHVVAQRSLAGRWLVLGLCALTVAACTSPSGQIGGAVAVDGAAGADGAVGGGTSDAGAAPELGKERDPGCTDGKFSEVLPTGEESIADLIAAYQPKAVMAFITGVLARRYPIGETLVEGAIANAKSNCVDTFLLQSQRGSASEVLGRMGVIVHECGHFFDFYAKGKGFGESHYQFNQTVAFTCSGGGNQGQQQTFSRSLITGDKWNAANPGCAKLGDKGCDPYALIYLNGDPTDSKLESGDQGFNMLMEEVVQYINSLAEAVAFHDQIKGSASARDGILTFLWYMERYLQMARLQYPESYQVISGDPCWRNAILTAWGRGWLYLNATEGDPKLAVNGTLLLKNAREPALMDEIVRIRAAHGCQ